MVKGLAASTVEFDMLKQPWHWFSALTDTISALRIGMYDTAFQPKSPILAVNDTLLSNVTCKDYYSSALDDTRNWCRNV